jgi:hypothetical protein
MSCFCPLNLCEKIGRFSDAIVTPTGIGQRAFHINVPRRIEGAFGPSAVKERCVEHKLDGLDLCIFSIKIATFPTLSVCVQSHAS